MQVIEIKKLDFIEDVREMTVEAIKEKYGLNNASYYKVLKDCGLKPDRRNERKSFRVVG